MAAHATTTLAPEIDPGGIERPIARRMPAFMAGAVGILGIAWWMAAQPPAGPGWGDPNGPQQQAPQGQGPQQNPPPQPPAPSTGCSACSSVDCGDCSGLEGLDCSGVDCSGIDVSCTVSGASGASVSKSCGTNPWRRLAGSSGLLLPLFVLIGWRRRLRR
jgi:hypothetical protein